MLINFYPQTKSDGVHPVAFYHGMNEKFTYGCPKCTLHIEEGQEVCPWCGTKIDWKKEEDNK